MKRRRHQDEPEAGRRPEQMINDVDRRQLPGRRVAEPPRLRPRHPVRVVALRQRAGRGRRRDEHRHRTAGQSATTATTSSTSAGSTTRSSTRRSTTGRAELRRRGPQEGLRGHQQGVRQAAVERLGLLHDLDDRVRRPNVHGVLGPNLPDGHVARRGRRRRRSPASRAARRRRHLAEAGSEADSDAARAEGRRKRCVQHCDG